MSRHQGVYNMIKHGGYQDEDQEEEEEQQPTDDDYADHNFNISELRVINSLCEIFVLQFTRKDIIDALYETDGDQDAAFEYLSNKLKKQIKPKQQPQIKKEEPPIIPQLIKQQSNNVEKSKNQFHIDYDVDKYNANYPTIKYKNPAPQNQATSIVIIGHVDTGKSTLTGRLLQMLKSIDEKEVRRNAKEAKTMGKESFSFAYATDQTKEEKEKGVTMDMAYKSVSINGRLFHLLDSPGHQDFTPHLIAGAAQADYAILVVDTTKNAFENSIALLKEKLQLLRAMDINQVIVALNKMDQINWDQKQFDFAREYILTSMGKLGYKGTQLSFVPISAFQGLNIITKQDIKWYQGGTLVEQIQKLNVIKRKDDQPFRFTILNRYHQNEGKLRGTCLFGKLHSGILEKNIQYVILPQGIYCEVKEFEKQEGDILEIRIKTLIESEFSNIQIGSVLSSIDHHIPVANRLLCQISTLDLQTPIIRGSQFLMHLDAQKIQVVVKKMNHTFDNDCVTIKKKFPRAIVSNEFAEIELETDSLVCVETRQNIEQLSRVVLREKFTLVGIGHVTYINVNEKKLKQGKVIHEQQI